MLRYKELKEIRKEVEQTEAEWSNAQKDAEADKLAREQSKNKLLTLCIEYGWKFKCNALVTSLDDVNKLNARIHKHDEQDQLAVMSCEIKFKRVVFSELLSDFEEHQCKNLVLVLLNWEMIDGICEKLYAKHYATQFWCWQGDAL